MNEKTIRDLYLGKIHPEKSQGYKTEVYREHLEEFCNLYESIKAVLPEESRKTLETMIEEYNVSQGEVIIDAFVKGFEIGMRLTAEGLTLGEECRIRLSALQTVVLTIFGGKSLLQIHKHCNRFHTLFFLLGCCIL